MATCRRSIVLGALVLAVALVMPALTVNAAEPGRTPDIVKTTPAAVVSQPLAEVSRLYYQRLKMEGEKPGPIQYREVNPLNTEIPAPRLNAPAPSGQVDTVVQDQFGPLAMPTPTVNIEGVNSDANAAAFGYRVEPPDTEGAVGPDNYVEWVNLLIQVYDKNGNSLAGPFPGNQLFTALGGTCASSNDGDPIVVYDKMAGRWLMSQFTGSNHQCIAVSTTSDPLGTFYLYDFDFSPAFPDYPKFGVWPDGYYYTARAFDPSFSGPIVGAFDRAAMLNGDPASFQGYTLDFYGSGYLYYAYVPINFEGTNNPPAGAPGLFGEYTDDADAIPPPHNIDGLQLLAMTIDWANPGNTTLGEAAYLAVASFDSNMCNNNRNCIPMLGTSEGVDALADRLMFQLKYRNLGDHQAIVASHTVDATGTDVGGVRWYELRADTDDSNWSVYQQGTYAPDSNSRFMGDVQMDGSGNIMIGYTTSSASMYPSVRAAGRLAGDPLDHMSQGELNIVDGTGYKTSGYYRWGDYSSVSIDPADDCTFWFAQEYVKTSGSFQWATQLTAVKFPTCGGPTGSVSGMVLSSATLDPIAGASVEFAGTGAAPTGNYSTTTDASGHYSIMLPVDTYDATASKFGYGSQTVTGIVVNEGDDLTQDFALDPVGSGMFDGYVTDAGHGWPLYAKVEISVQGAAPVATVYTDPFNGYYVTPELPQGYNYEFLVTAMYPGYNPMGDVVMMPPGGMAMNFAFEPDGACTAPGYELMLGGMSVSENFDAGLPGDWSVVNNGGDCVWTDTNPGGRSNLTGGSGTFMIADSDDCYIGTTMNTDLISPAYDFTGQSAATFTFKSDYNNLSSAESADVLISTDNGSTWTLINHWNTDVRGPYTFSQVVATNGSDQVKFMWHYVATGWDWWWEVDDFAAEGAACLPIPGTLVGGFVNDANTGMAINGATVESNTGPTTQTMGTPDDPNIPDGFWWNFEPMPGLGPSTRTFTASAPNYASEDVEINVVPDTMNQINFALGAGWLEMNPTELISRLYPGQTEDQAMAVINHGMVDANVKMLTVPVALTWDHASPVKDTSNLPGNHDPISIGRAPQAAGPIVNSLPSGLALAGAPAYGVDLFASTLQMWPDVTVPGTWNTIAGGMGSYFAGDFMFGDFSKLYVLDYDTNTFGTVDTTTGAFTGIGSSVPGGGESWTGLTAALDGTLYASATTCASSTLYTVDPGSGALTTVGPITNGACIIDIAINAAGELYGVDIVADTLVQIDPGTGAGTVIGSTGVAANYAQGMDFDEVTGTLYWAAYTGSGELRIIDTATGASTLVGPLPGGTEVDSFAIATSAGVSLPWLVLTPDEGVVPGGEGTMPINAEFIADGAPHYGLFKASIGMSHDTPYDVPNDTAWFTKAFWDIPPGYWADPYIHALAGVRVTVGCGFGDFCPDQTLLRKHMSVFLERMMYGPDYMPPPAVGLFADVPVEDYNTIANYIEALYNDGVTAGCRIEDGLMYFCPDVAVDRDQMAVFICRAKGWDPVDPPTGVFNDVPPDYWAAGYIERLVNEEVTAGCGGGNYCPHDPINRAQIAVFLVKAWHVEYLMN